jgi:bacillithiol system protein YtxJ
MGWFSSSKSNDHKLNWENLSSLSQLDELLTELDAPILLFKHSTRCSISSMALSRFEAEWNSTTNCRLIFLDLLAHRDLSNEIASRTHVEHQSPQVIVIYQGVPIYNASHNSISAAKIEQLIANL